ncbi:MAG: glycosyltransferase family 2 protein [Kaiparowitsia implicata GSE-PSE-MK54-09C]|jgi:glycosyltransferase involved in cell wall biosynthesis|nr:glycosyltransferase family 2 protein [Kaiparowitsia implicata GSE-PSE-MK54-09C]
MHLPPGASDVPSIDLSVVIPLFNEASNIEHLFERLEAVLNRLSLSYEIVCVDDGSRDNTLGLLIGHRYRNPRIKVLSLSRNFGKEIALSAGLDYTVGAAVVPMDADLQDPPELIETLLAKWREGFSVVYAVRRSRQGDDWLKRTTARAFYRVIHRMSDVSIPQDTGDFRLLDRQIVNILKQMPERTRFMKGLFAWVGFKQTAVLYDRPPRLDGRSSWNYWKLWNFALDGIVSFSQIPLKIWSYIGLGISVLALLYALFLVIRTLILGVDVPGYASLMVAVLTLGGMQLITMGILGEYLGRVYEEVKARPLYIVRGAYGFADDDQIEMRVPRRDGPDPDVPGRNCH